MKRYKIDFKTMAWEEPTCGVRFKAYEQDRKKLRLVEFFREFVEPDWCTKAHIGYILEGQIEIDFDGNVVVFQSGDGVFIPEGQKHKHKGQVLTDKVKIVLVEEN